MFSQTMKMKGSVAEVVALLCDVRLMTQNHPYVVSVTADLSVCPTADAGYVIVDRIPYLGEVKYFAWCDVVDNMVLWTARAPCGVVVKTTYVVETAGLVTETCEVTGPPIVAWFAERAARKAHVQVFQALASSRAGSSRVS